MPAEVLSPRALNRALLSRQLLLDRPHLPDETDGRRAAVISAIEHLVGLQAQAPFPPYYGLWSRLGGFRPEDLGSLITDRSVVSTENLKRFYTINGIFPGSVLIDGFVAGLWRLARNSGSATLTIELFGPEQDLDPVVGEAERMLAFCAADASGHIRFAAIG